MKRSSLLGKPLASLAIRGISLGGKTLLIILLGRYATAADLGIYGIFSSTIILAGTVAGFEFYTYSGRELLAPERDAGSLVFGHFSFVSLVTLLTATATVFLLSTTGLLARAFLPLFFGILLFSTISNHLVQILVYLSRPVAAQLVLLVRDGLWGYIAVYFLIHGGGLHTVFQVWTIGTLLAVMLGAVLLAQALPRMIPWKLPSSEWFKKGIRISSLFVLTAFSYKLVEFADRYLIDLYLDREHVGMYTLFASLANLLTVLTATTVDLFFYPKLIKYWNHNDRTAFAATVRAYLLRTAVITIPGALIGWFAVEPFLSIIGKESFIPYLPAYAVLLVSATVTSFATVPHYILFATKRDTATFTLVFLAVLINIVFNCILIPLAGISGAAFATLASMLFLLIARWKAVKSHMHT